MLCVGVFFHVVQGAEYREPGVLSQAEMSDPPSVPEAPNLSWCGAKQAQDTQVFAAINF